MKPLFFWMVLLLVWLPVSAQGDPHRIGVLYPDIREPFRSVFASIVEGIEQHAGDRVERYPLGKDVDQAQLRRWLKEKHIKVIIALGRRSASVSKALGSSIPVVTGAVLMSPDLDNNSETGIVLNPDPMILFRRLKKLAPGVRHISVVYNPERNRWLIRQAQSAASRLSLKLKAYPVADLRESAQVYRRILENTSGNRNALWILTDRSIFDEKAVFPLVLKTAWDREFVVFSSNPAHVKRGALFAMYPDNVAMGRRLAKIALQRTTPGQSGKARMLPLADLLIAFNLRTAEHLNLAVDRRRREEFDLVFPHR